MKMIVILLQEMRVASLSVLPAFQIIFSGIYKCNYQIIKYLASVFPFKRHPTAILICSMVLVSAIKGYGQITFETIPGETPFEGKVIRNQFLATDNVTFRFEDGSDAILAKVGPPVYGFYGPPNSTKEDTPAPNQGVGNYFLTRKFSQNTAPPPLVISYSNPVSGASAQLLDIDGNESVTIEVRGQNGSILEKQTIRSGDPGTGDGIATTFTISRAQNDIYSLRLVPNGLAGAGIAFDNFNASIVQQPCGPPGLTGHTSWMNISRTECFTRARNALRAAGFRLTNENTTFFEGQSELHSSFIACICTIEGIQPSEETLVAITVASPKTWTPGPEPIRNFLINFMRNPATAGAPPSLTNSRGSGNQNPNSYTPGVTPNLPSGQTICDNPRAMDLIDEWINNAHPPQLPGESLAYDPWGRLIGVSKTALLTYNGPPNTVLSRCEYVWQWAADLQSTNIGTLKEFVMGNL